MNAAWVSIDDLRIFYDYHKNLSSFLGRNDYLKSCVVLTTVRRSCDATSDVDIDYGLAIFQICHCAELRKNVEVTLPINPYDDRTVSCRGRMKRMILTSNGHREIIGRQILCPSHTHTYGLCGWYVKPVRNYPLIP